MRLSHLECRAAFADKGFRFCLAAITITIGIALSSLLLVPLQSAAQVGQYVYTGATNIITLAPGNYTITAYGAQGGADTGPYAGAGGLGAEMSREFSFSGVTTLTLLVAGSGEDAPYGGSGGGGSFVVNGATPLVVAGGGGGGGANNSGNGSTGSSGNPGSFGGGGGGGSGGSGGAGVPQSGGAGGGGYSGNGVGYEFGGGQSFLNGGAGGSPGPTGGFGGGGAGGVIGGGGGGGYSGGGGGSYYGGGGGGSYIDSSAIADVTEVSGIASPDDSPNGEIIIAQLASFIEQPSLTTAFTSNATFQVVVQGPPPLTFQWLFNGTPLSDNGHYLGSTETNLTITDFEPADIGNYNLVVSNYAGSITSAVATINILNPSITSQPQSQSVFGGATVNFSVSATGQQPLAYQWQFNGTNLPDATTNPLVLNNVLVSQSGMYSVIVTNSYGTVASSNATLSVTALSIVYQPLDQSVLVGGTATFSVFANGQQPYFYQWLFNGTNLPDATNNPLVLTNVIPSEEGNYSVVITNAYGMAVSSNALLTEAPLAITTQPTNFITWPYGLARFTVNVTGPPPFGFDWQCNGVDIPGSWTNVLTLTNVPPSQFGNYDVIVSNVWGSVTSTNAILSLSQVAVWGGSAGETNLIPGLTNVVAIVAGYPYNGYDCMVLRSNGSAIHWPAPNTGPVTNLLAIGGGDGPYLVLERNGKVAELMEDYALSLLSGFTNVVALPPDTIYSVIALRSNGIPVFPPGGTSGAPTNSLTNVVSIAQGSGFTLALKSDGTVVGWGGNPGAFVTPGLSNVVAIAASYYTGFAVKNDGTVAAWGPNFGGLVTGAANLTNVVAISAGQFHALALLANGTVSAWGENTYGGTNVPPGLTNVIAISAGQSQSMALIGNGPPILKAALSDPIIGTNGCSFSIPSQGNRVYMLQYLNSVTDTNWVSLPLVPGTGGAILLKDPSPTNSQRFYRVLRW